MRKRLSMLTASVVLLFANVFARADPPHPEVEESVESFVERWNAWVDSVPQDQRAGESLVDHVDEINGEAFTSGEFYEKHGYNEGDLLSEAFPETEFWEDAPRIFRTFDRELERLYELANRPHIALSIVDELDPHSPEFDADWLMVGERQEQNSALRHATMYLVGHSKYLAFTGQVDAACDRLLAAEGLAEKITELPTSIAWVRAAAIKLEFSGTIIEMLQHDPDLFSDEQLAGFQSVIVDQLGSGFADTVRFEEWLWIESWRLVINELSLTLADQEVRDALYENAEEWERYLRKGRHDSINRPSAEAGVPLEPIADQIKLFKKLNNALLEDLRRDPATLVSLRFSEMILEHFAGDGVSRYLPVGGEVCNWRSTLGSQFRMDYQARNTLVVLGIYRHRLRTGNWPESLLEINPDLLPFSTTDLYSGEPLGYTLDTGFPWLWAHGADRDDDNGRTVIEIEGQYGDPVSEWFSIDEWIMMNAEEQSKHDGDWDFWSHTKD